MNKFKLDWLILPFFGFGIVLALWAISSATWASNLPSPLKTWEASKDYILQPFAKRGEMDQGILRFTWYSLQLVSPGIRCSSSPRVTRWRC
jgi:nitrate/nitrite transport system permease protein